MTKSNKKTRLQRKIPYLKNLRTRFVFLRIRNSNLGGIIANSLVQQMNRKGWMRKIIGEPYEITNS